MAECELVPSAIHHKNFHGQPPMKNNTDQDDFLFDDNAQLRSHGQKGGPVYNEIVDKIRPIRKDVRLVITVLVLCGVAHGDFRMLNLVRCPNDNGVLHTPYTRSQVEQSSISTAHAF
ncbi:hypothetical protein GGU11DRAFT_812410 [Lentinula aff. detonsa]|nr:hypothetical protein GGU11DRAFT_812410 [Lentinula aff. detonsa]